MGRGRRVCWKSLYLLLKFALNLKLLQKLKSIDTHTHTQTFWNKTRQDDQT